MNFTNLNDIREHLDSLKRKASNDNNASYFSKLEINSFYLDLFAGHKALCEPRLVFDNLLHYKKIQLSINEKIKEQEHAISPGIDSRFVGFPWLKYFTYVNSKSQVKPSYMGEMIPIDEAISLIRDVYKIGRLKIFF